MNKELMFSSKNQAWATPRDLFRELNKKYKFTLDPCAEKDNAVCKTYFNEKQDGLKQSWKGKKVFINPPFKDVGKWVKKAYDEVMKNGCKVAVLLIAARTDTKWYHNYVWDAKKLKFRPHVKYIQFVPGRLVFGTDKYWRWVWKQKKLDGKFNKLYGTKKKNPATFPSLIVEFRKGR